MDQRLLGLTLGERVLLALSHRGIKRVAFAGPGSRPSSQRAELEVVELGTLDMDELHIVVPCDAVFDARMLDEATLPEGVCLALRSGSELRACLDDPQAALTSLGRGRAESGQDFGIRVVDAASARAAKRSLKLSLRKPIDGLVSTYLNRYLSLFCSQFFVKTGLAPNVFTVAFMFIGLAAAVLASQPQYAWALIVAGLLFQAQSVLDGCDGEMARLTYRFSSTGQWLDTIGDDLTNYSVCFGLAIGQAHLLDRPELFWLGAGVLAMQLACSIVLYRRMRILGTGDLLAIPDMVTGREGSQSLISRITAPLSLIFKRDSFVFILSIVIATGHPLLAFYLYGLGTIPVLIAVMMNEYRIVQNERSVAHS